MPEGRRHSGRNCSRPRGVFWDTPYQPKKTVAATLALVQQACRAGELGSDDGEQQKERNTAGANKELAPLIDADNPELLRTLAGGDLQDVGPSADIEKSPVAALNEAIRELEESPAPVCAGSSTDLSDTEDDIAVRQQRSEKREQQR